MQEHAAGDASGRGNGEHQAGALLAHHRQHGAGDVHRAEQQRLDLVADLIGAEFLEEAGVEVAGVVDQDVDAAEPRDGGLDRGLRVLGAGDVELHGQQVVVVADRRRDLPGSRPVATTAWPAASAALAMSTPRPRPAPVMSQTFLSVMGRSLQLRSMARL